MKEATKAKIFECIAEVIAEGNTPTIETINSRIGGSYSTISAVLKEWKAEQNKQEQTITEPLPEVLKGETITAITNAWNTALLLANDRIKAEREQIKQDKAEAESERTEALSIADGLGEQNELLKQEIETLKQDVELLSKEKENFSLLIVEKDSTITAMKNEIDRMNNQIIAFAEKMKPVESVKNSKSVKPKAKSVKQETSNDNT